MGCTPSKTSSTVHPLDSNSNTNGILQVQELSPDQSAHSSTPNNNIRGDSPTTSTTPQFEASELQQRLQSHVSGTRERPRFVRQFSNETNGDCVDGGSVDLPPAKNATNSWGVDEVKKCEARQNEVQNNEENSSASSTNPDQSQPPKPFIPPGGSRPAKHPLQLQFGTDSQVEFFKMLDKRINEGPNYAPSRDQVTDTHTGH